MNRSFSKLIHQDMQQIKKASDYIVPSDASYAISVDISRIDNPSVSIESIVHELVDDVSRAPLCIYYCPTTMILFFPSVTAPAEHMFKGSHQRILSWFSGHLNLLFHVQKKIELVVAVLTEFKTTVQMVEYFLWACQVHERSFLVNTVLQHHPTLDCREFTLKELESHIDHDTLTRESWTKDRYGLLFSCSHIASQTTVHSGPFRGDRMEEYVVLFKRKGHALADSQK